MIQAIRRNIIFVLTCAVAIGGYGFFVFAAPPGPGGYNPGETLDPECTPGQLVPEPCIVQLTSGSSSGWGLSGNTVTGGVSASIDTVFNGVGLNDITITGPFTGDSPATWVIVITATGTPDQMDVIINGDVEYSGDVFPPGPFPVDDGLVLNFGSDTGHTIGDSWEFTMTPASGGTTAFLGTLNNEDLIFKTNNIERMRLLSNGDISLVQYQSPRDDSGSYSPINFLYTDGDGNLMSAPISLLGGGGGADGNIYDNDGTLAGNRILDGGGNELAFNNLGSFNTNAGNNLIAFDTNGISLQTFADGNDLILNTAAVTTSDLILQVNESFPTTNRLLIQGLTTDNLADQVLAKDGTGKSVWRDVSSLGGGSDTSIYLNDGTLAGNRALDADGNNLTFSNLDQLLLSTQSGITGMVMSDKGSGYGVVLLQGQELISSDDHRSQISTDIGDGNYDADFDDLHLGLVDVSSIADNGAAIEVNATTGIRFRFRNTGVMSNYFFPRTDGTTNQVLSTDGLGQISWVTLEESPFTIENTTSLFSTGLVGTGTNSLATGANFIGASAGYDAINANYSNFIGYSAGGNATNASESNFIGHEAGQNASAANYSNFFGYSAGSGATSAAASNFFGANAGQNAINAYNSNFIGTSAGYDATNAFRSYFQGAEAGRVATNANNSNFTGYQAGYHATNANNSNFLGYHAGYDATNANNSNFLGHAAGETATNASLSSFIGYESGSNAANARNSIFIGQHAGFYDSVNNTGNADDFSILIGKDTYTNGFSNSIAIGGSATNTASNQLQIGSTTRTIASVSIGNSKGTASADNTFFVGVDAGLNATNALQSNFLGYEAGKDATDAYLSNFFGGSAGLNAINANFSNFIGPSAGADATNASYSNFLGLSAGMDSTGANRSNFFGFETGRLATNASKSNFIGDNSGTFATNASNSNFLGASAGYDSTNSNNSIFIGTNAGMYRAPSTRGTQNAANSIFIGVESATTIGDLGLDTTTDPDDFAILIGNYTSTAGFENSIALGQRATNTASNQFMIGSATRPIDTTRINGSASTQCTITTGTGIACTSDERVKTNITDLSSDTLTKLSNVKTVSYNWLQNPTSKTQIGFLAQDLEQYFPELVETDSVGMKSVYYAQMTPILVEAIREMNLNVTQIADMTRENTWRDSLISWLGNASNKITRIFTGELCLYDENGQTECINASELRALKQSQNIQTTPEVPPPTVDTPPEDTPPETGTE